VYRTSRATRMHYSQVVRRHIRSLGWSHAQHASDIDYMDDKHMYGGNDGRYDIFCFKSLCCA